MNTLRFRLGLVYVGLVLVACLVMGGSVGGVLAFLADRGQITVHGWEPVLRTMWIALSAAVVVALVLSVGVGLRFSSRLTAPLRDMTRVARALARGELGVRADSYGRDELGDLARALNEMAARFASQVEALSLESARLETILANLTAGVLVIDDRGRLTLTNAQAREMLRVGGEEVGRLHIEVTKNYALSTAIDRVLAEGEPLVKTLSLLQPEERWVDAHVAPLPAHEPGRRPGVVVVLHDVTEVQRLARMRADFVANVSHELRTPVTAIKGFAETLLDPAAGSPEDRRTFLQIVHEEAIRLQRLVEDVLDLHRIESGRLEFRLAPCDLVDVVGSTLGRFEQRAQEAGISLRVDLLPGPVQVRADRDRLEQVLVNLLDNALKYTPAGKAVSVSMRCDDGRAVVGVHDTGPGIPKADLPRVFERFYRVDKGRSRKTGGTGLGLSIAKHIVENHGGTIWAESVLGSGSSFYFTLPLEGTENAS